LRLGETVLPAAAGVAAAGLVAGGSQSVAWDVSRAAGFVAYLVLATSTASGLATSSLVFRRYLPQADVIDLHIWGSYLTVAAVLVHVLPLLFDRWIGFRVVDLVVPFASPFKPAPVAAGIVCGYLLLILLASFLAKRRIGSSRWRLIHWLSFPAFGLALFHAVKAGSDTGALLPAGLYLASGGCIFCLTLVRILVSRNEAPRARRQATPAGTVRP
jgi:predicted ferric reductase